MAQKPPKKEEKIFYEALEKSPEQREAFLKEACGKDQQLYDRVKALIKAHDIQDGFLESPILNSEVTLDEYPLSEAPGTKIGRYKLLEQIGEGGMAVVFMAEQTQPFQRRVALKIIKLGMDTRQVIARFEVERQVLAMMDHPNIAKVHDAGITETGRPYFVMELVRGISITEYCDKNNLSTQDRLRLFIPVCQAIQHAHQKGIIHRDIKPSNVLVTMHDGIPMPKVIDFGIAKAVNQRLTEKTLFTRFAQMIGTPEYMSPEQAEMSALDVDTRTDIYSLGVLLYELLIGITPFPGEELRSKGYMEIQRIIRETDPDKPSTKLSTLGDSLTDIAKHRKCNPDSLRKSVQGDLDWIVMKTLEKDRTRRYETAHGLAEDIERHLNYEPVLAGPPGRIYSLKKFLRKHRKLVIAAGVMTVLAACVVVVSVMYIRQLNRSEKAEALDHRNLLASVQQLFLGREFSEAKSQVEALVDSKYIGPEARLLHARITLEMQGPGEALKELEKLLDERDEVAGQAHYLLARIYYDGDPGAPERTEEYRLQWEHHQREAERLLPKTADTYLLKAVNTSLVPKTLELLKKALELDESHYGSLRERAYWSYAANDYYKMAKDAARMINVQPKNELGYALSAIAQRELGQFDDAIEDHDRAIRISPEDARLYDQRHQTFLRMGKHHEALSDAQRCVQLEPNELDYHVHVFCAFVALGRYDDAKAKYDEIMKSDLTRKGVFPNLTYHSVIEAMHHGLPWHPPGSQPEGSAFFRMYEAEKEYRYLAARAKLTAYPGFHPSWSPDGACLTYSKGKFGSTCVAILDIETGKTRILASPGKDPEWSPDGKYIAYVRDRKILSSDVIPVSSFDRLTGYDYRVWGEVWLVKADGTEEPRFLAKGGWPCWGPDSKRVFYRSRPSEELFSIYSISIEDNSEPVLLMKCPDYVPAVSPDGKYVAYGHESESFHIVELVTQSEVVNLKIPLSIRPTIHWSPDGQELILPAFGGGGGLRIYDRKKGEVWHVLKNGGNFVSCNWSSAYRSNIAIVGTASSIWMPTLILICPQPKHLVLRKHLKNTIRRRSATVHVRFKLILTTPALIMERYRIYCF